MIKTRLLAPVLGLSLLIGAVAVSVAQPPPKRNVNPGRHPNLAAAQQLSQRAFERIIQAQKANEWDLDGHAQKAKELLDQVNQQLKLAAGASNRNK